MNKPELRTEMRRLLLAMDAVARQSASAHICTTIAQMPAWRNARVICAFVPLPGEPQIQPLWERENSAVFCFPRIVGEDVELLRIDDRAGLRDIGWKLDAPVLDACPRIVPAELDVILVPGLAFTRDGHRLGRGGGHYDRLLSRCTASTLKIGVCFATQLREDLPLEAHDCSVNVVASDSSE